MIHVFILSDFIEKCNLDGGRGLSFFKKDISSFIVSLGDFGHTSETGRMAVGTWLLTLASHVKRLLELVFKVAVGRCLLLLLGSTSMSPENKLGGPDLEEDLTCISYFAVHHGDDNEVVDA